ncbi:hypothetical protein QN277_003461 [Acacia crassicarpa]|uniref:Secreted protein n=1 Tax=Acacia crassicarpa TaxID=499986 RepID=A0AAE1IYF3_9FABA|nr:hypothetical protein QN277_003461 [Acacia crassicarpa]
MNHSRCLCLSDLCSLLSVSVKLHFLLCHGARTCHAHASHVLGSGSVLYRPSPFLCTHGLAAL